MSYAYYRLPYGDSYTLIESDRNAKVLASFSDLGTEQGFVIAPFCISASCPLLLIHPDSITRRTISTENNGASATNDTDQPNGPSVPTDPYREAFSSFHEAVSHGTFRKLVLARQKKMEIPLAPDVTQPQAMRSLFEEACHLYPRLMIMLFYTPQSGAWLLASPEILMDGERSSLHTVALAGTMPFEEGYMEWSDKNKEEQHIVELYIEDILQQYSNDVLKDGPVTVRAGNLVHLRTDFRFHLSSDTPIGHLIEQLHPTPAVCGLPKQEAKRFIMQHEGMQRNYYSGFAGPMGIDGETHLYVSLRCAELTTSSATLYAGGGILPESQCESEFAETESKMKTIGHVLQ